MVETKEETWQALFERRLVADRPYREFGTYHRESHQISFRWELEFELASPLLEYREGERHRRF